MKWNRYHFPQNRLQLTRITQIHYPEIHPHKSNKTKQKRKGIPSTLNYIKRHRPIPFLSAVSLLSLSLTIPIPHSPNKQLCHWQIQRTVASSFVRSSLPLFKSPVVWASDLKRRRRGPFRNMHGDKCLN